MRGASMCRRRQYFPSAHRPTKRRHGLWRQFAREVLGFVPSATSADVETWREFLARRYANATALSLAYGAHGGCLDDDAAARRLPADGAPLADWYQFESIVLAMRRTAHRFTVLLPVHAATTPKTTAAQRLRSGAPHRRAREARAHGVRRCGSTGPSSESARRGLARTRSSIAVDARRTSCRRCGSARATSPKAIWRQRTPTTFVDRPIVGRDRDWRSHGQRRPSHERLYDLRRRSRAVPPDATQARQLRAWAGARGRRSTSGVRPIWPIAPSGWLAICIGYGTVAGLRESATSR